MKKEVINLLLKTNQLRIRQLDIGKIKSMIESGEINVKVIKSLELNEETSTVIFREVYESIRQLGDARLWLLGYEPMNHEVSMEILREMDIKEKVKLNHLARFRKIRNDANYRGFKVTVAQANEILDFWDKCAKEIIEIILKDLKKFIS